MKKIVTALLVLSLMALVGSGLAQDGKKNKKKRGGFDPSAALVKKATDAGLPEDAIAKIKSAAAEHGPKLREAQAKVNSILTEDQRKARNEAQKAAKAAGKKGKEAQADIAAAIKLTPEQKTEMEAAQKNLNEALAAFRKSAAEQLSDDQKAALGLTKKKKK